MAVSTVSYVKTPQAGNDYYEYLEDLLAAGQVVTLDVMSNDLGGNAKKLYSIDDGAGALADLLTRDPGTTTSWETTSGGNLMRIANGKIEYKVGANTNLNQLAEGEEAVDTFVYAIQMGNGTLSYAKVTVIVTGQNDGATISGDAAGSVTENDAASFSGKLVVVDLDHDQSLFQSPASTAGDYGSFTFATDGNWSYSLDARAESLRGGEVVSDTLEVTSLDGTATELITVTITGKNDAASIDGDTVGAVAEDGTSGASGTLSVSDVDHDEDTFDAVSTQVSNYGEFEFNAALGEWTYALDNALAQSLGAGDTATETLTVASLDGTDTQVVEVTITGVNDVATITGTDSGTVTEDGTLTAFGNLDVSDDDNGEAVFVAPASLAGSYGSFTFAADTGAWSYQLSNSNASVQALNANQSLTDTLTVQSLDGTAHAITVTIAGADEPVIRIAAPAPYTGSGDANDFDTLTATPTGNNTTTQSSDVLVGTAGDDNFAPSGGNDTIYGLGGNDTTLAGGAGNDTIYGGAGNDRITGANDVDTLYGGSGADDIDGGNQNDTIYGGSGTDDITGGTGADIIIGGYGADTSDGQGDADTYKFLSLNDTGDSIVFVSGEDKLDFSAIDANTALVGDQAFVSATASTALVAHGINWFDDGINTFVQFDNDGNTTTAEFEIELTGVVNLSVAGTFVL